MKKIIFAFNLLLVMTSAYAITVKNPIASSFSTYISTSSIPTINWEACVQPWQVGFECAFINVPLDYAHPGETIELALIRHLADNIKDRVGTLFFNPGGPGGAGTDDLPRWFELFPKSVRERFDIVSWDPRGVGASTAMQCFNNQAEEARFFNGVPTESFPSTQKSQEMWVKRFDSYAKICKKRNGALLTHVSTADTACDLELLRLALNETSMNYLGVSYGTLLGAVYANLFPHHVRAMILDGNIDPNAYFGDDLSTSMRLKSDMAIAKSVNEFINLCGKASVENCVFSTGNGSTTRTKFDLLLKNIEQRPAIISGKTIGNAELLSMMNAYLFTTRAQACDKSGDNCAFKGWQRAAMILQELWKLSKDEQTIFPLNTQNSIIRNEDNDKNKYEKYTSDHQVLAIQCSESPNYYPVEKFINLVEKSISRSGKIGAVVVWGDEPCSSWSSKADSKYTGPWNQNTPNTILVIGNTFDPSTPYEGATAMAKALANSRLVTLDGYGHTALLNPSNCIDQIESEYLINGTLPNKGTICRQNQGPFEGSNGMVPADGVRLQENSK